MQSLTLVGRSEDVLHDSSLHRTDIILEDIMEKQFHFYREGTEEEVRYKIERVFHPLFLVFAQLIVSNAIWILNIVQHTVDANLDLLEQFVRPNLAKVEADDGLGRARVVRLDLLKLLMSVGVSYVGQLGGDIGCFLIANRVLLRHEPMEQAVVHEVLCVLHPQILVIFIVELNLAHGGLNVGNQVH